MPELLAEDPKCLIELQRLLVLLLMALLLSWSCKLIDHGAWITSAVKRWTVRSFDAKASGIDGNHIPPHGPKGTGSKGSGSSPEWLVVNRAKRKWASVWRPIATNSMSLEASTTNPMYTTELYKSVAVNENSVTGNGDSSEELKNTAPKDGGAGEAESGTDVTENQAQPVLWKYSMMDDPSGYLLYREVAKIYTTGIGAKQRRVQLERELDTMPLDKEWTGNCVTFLTKFSKTVDQHREMRGPHAHSGQYYIDKLDAAIAPHPMLGAYSSELDMFDTRLEKRLRDILKAAGRNVGDNPITVAEEAAETYEDHLNVLLQRAIQIDNEAQIRKKGDRKANNANSSQGTPESNQGGGDGKKKGKSNRQANNANSNSSGGNGDNIWRRYSKEEWNDLPGDKKKEILRIRKEHKENKNRQANQTNQQASNNGTPQGNQQQQGSNSNQGNQPGSILRGMMSANQAMRERVDNNGVRWREVNSARINYRVSKVKVSDGLALCDSGANGGMAGSDCRILERSTTRSVTVTGVTDGVIESPLCTASAVVNVLGEDGKTKDVILMMHQYAAKPDGNTIHSKVQLEHMGLVVDDTPIAHGGFQMVITREGYIIPLQVRDGLCYMKMRPPTDEELSSLPHVFMTSDDEWDPSAVDNDGPDLEGIENHPDVVRIREQQDRRIDDQVRNSRTQPRRTEERGKPNPEQMLRNSRKIGARSGSRLKIAFNFLGSEFDHLQFREGIRRNYHRQ